MAVQVDQWSSQTFGWRPARAAWGWEASSAVCQRTPRESVPGHWDFAGIWHIWHLAQVREARRPWQPLGHRLHQADQCKHQVETLGHRDSSWWSWPLRPGRNHCGTCQGLVLCGLKLTKGKHFLFFRHQQAWEAWCHGRHYQQIYDIRKGIGEESMKRVQGLYIGEKSPKDSAAQIPDTQKVAKERVPGESNGYLEEYLEG